MTLLNQFRQGSYRGVIFDTFSWGRTKKKKYTEHEFVNSNRRFIEERGVLNPDFSVTLSIFGKDDFIQKRNALRKALDTEGEGVLVLPFEGEFNVKCVEYSDNQEIIDNFGRCDFTVTFKVSSENEYSGNPVQTNNSKILIANTSKSLRERLSKIVNENIFVSNSISYRQGVDKLNNFVEDLLPIANRVANGSLSSMLKNFSSNIPTFFSNNSNILGSAIATLFYTFESVCNNADILLSSAKALFNFGDTDIKVSPSTPERIEQIKNAEILNVQVQISALGIATNAFAQKKFENEIELQNTVNDIENEIKKIQTSRIFTNIKIKGIDNLEYVLKQLQVQFSDVVSEKELITPKITEIKVYNKSISKIAYQYYQNLDKVQDLIKLNNVKNPKNIDGKIRILTNEQ